jgi:uncharacterized membrane protein YbhN (UPF0104 family)
MPFVNFILTVPIILIIAGLPISVGGFGVRELATITILSAVGIPNAEATTIAILFIPILIIGSFPGLYFFLISKNRGAYLKNTDTHLLQK